MIQRKKRRGPLQFVQFSAVGIANAAIDIASLNLLLLIFPTSDRLLLLLFNTIAYSLSVANSYFWNATFTFKRTSKGNNRQRTLFIVQGAISLGVSNLVFISVNEVLDFTTVPNWMGYNIAKGTAMFLSFLSSFFMVKYFVFKDFGNRI